MWIVHLNWADQMCKKKFGSNVVSTLHSPQCGLQTLLLHSKKIHAVFENNKMKRTCEEQCDEMKNTTTATNISQLVRCEPFLVLNAL